jgi:hypothetical protein
MAKLTPLPEAPNYGDFSYLKLNEKGAFVRDDGSLVAPDGLPAYLREHIVLPKDATDVFVWVHGWRNTEQGAVRSGKRLFQAIERQQRRDGSRYPAVRPFVPAFVLVRWPSESNPLPAGYRRIRDRAKSLTEDGAAEFFLASLLGYLDRDRGNPKTLKSAAGFHLHCIGHSFGGRFLTAAIGAAAEPKSPTTLSLLKKVGKGERKTLSASASAFEFTVDSLTVFQMAAGSSSFGDSLADLIDKGPILGPIALTYSKHDRANCFWHKVGESGERAIGCEGARQPAGRTHTVAFRPLTEDYTRADLQSDITNVDASWAFRTGGIAEGAHSDFWWEESIHLVLSVVQQTR